MYRHRSIAVEKYMNIMRHRRHRQLKVDRCAQEPVEEQSQMSAEPEKEVSEQEMSVKTSGELEEEMEVVQEHEQSEEVFSEPEEEVPKQETSVEITFVQNVPQCHLVVYRCL